MVQAKKWLAIGLVSLLLLAFSPMAALAHVVGYDGDMVATLHIEPDDNPVAGKAEKITFIYGAVPDGFDARQCLCRLTITQSGKPVFDSPVQPSGTYFSEAAYTFKSAGAYRLTLAGDPKVIGDFKPFAIDYSIRVQPGGSNTSAAQKKLSPWLVIAAMVAPFAIAYSTLRYLAHRRRPRVD